MCDEQFHDWAKYYPSELQSHKHPSFIDIGILKINDIYRSFCYFNINLDLCLKPLDEHKNETEYLFMTNMHYQNCLFYINNCTDYFWQFLFCVCQPDTSKNYDHLHLENLLKTESIQNIVNEEINYLISLNKSNTQFQELQNTRKSLENEIQLKQIRQKYNYIKHRGTYHIKGLGGNNRTSFESLGLKVSVHLYENNEIDDCSPKQQVHRETLDLFQSITDLKEFKIIFIDTINKIIELMIPEDYSKTEGNIYDLINSFNFPIEITK